MGDYEKTEIMPQNLWPGWKTVRRIGEGSYGAVYEIERSIAGFTEKAALKFLTIPKSSAEAEALRSEGYTEEDVTQHFLDCLSDIEREYAVMAQIRNCENIVNRVVQKSSFVWSRYGYEQCQLYVPSRSRGLCRLLKSNGVIRKSNRRGERNSKNNFC